MGGDSKKKKKKEKKRRGKRIRKESWGDDDEWDTEVFVLRACTWWMNRKPMKIILTRKRIVKAWIAMIAEERAIEWDCIGNDCLESFANKRGREVNRCEWCLCVDVKSG